MFGCCCALRSRQLARNRLAGLAPAELEKASMGVNLGELMGEELPTRNGKMLIARWCFLWGGGHVTHSQVERSARRSLARGREVGRSFAMLGVTQWAKKRDAPKADGELGRAAPPPQEARQDQRQRHLVMLNRSRREAGLRTLDWGAGELASAEQRRAHASRTRAPSTGE